MFFIFTIIFKFCAIIGLPPTAALEPFGPSVHVEQFSFVGRPKYKPGFQHLDYANPEAPKGGALHLSEIGSLDSLNPFLTKGNKNYDEFFLIFQTLSYRPTNDPFSEYPLVAKDFDLAVDKTWLVVNLREEARWQDGTPITAEDLVFTFQALMSDAASKYYAQVFADVVSVTLLDPHRVLFRFKNGNNRELPGEVACMPVLQKKFYQSNAFGQTTMKAPIGSGPYKIESADSRRIVFIRDQNFWAKDLPIQKGLFNFDRIVVDYFNEPNIAFEAFKAGQVDFYRERSTARWANGYDFPAVKDGRIRRDEIHRTYPVLPNGFVFNLRKNKFKSRYLRQAFAELTDFDFLNKKIFHDGFERATSYFQDYELMAKGLPSPAEMELLSPFAKSLPPEIFISEVKFDSFSNHPRDHLRNAYNLFLQAGFKFRRKNGPDSPVILIDPETDKPLSVEFLGESVETENIFLKLCENLKKFGIITSVRTVDQSQYEYRLRSFDFDIIYNRLEGTASPGNELRDTLSSQTADQQGSDNYSGLKDPAVDFFIDSIITAQKRGDIVTRAKALDRILIGNYYFIPFVLDTKTRFAYWNRLGFVHISDADYVDPMIDWWAQ